MIWILSTPWNYNIANHKLKLDIYMVYSGTKRQALLRGLGTSFFKMEYNRDAQNTIKRCTDGGWGLPI